MRRSRSRAQLRNLDLILGMTVEYRLCCEICSLITVHYEWVDVKSSPGSPGEMGSEEGGMWGLMK